jgi:predicted acetyltransferase
LVVPATRLAARPGGAHRRCLIGHDAWVPELVAPAERVHASYLAAIRDFQAEGHFTDIDVENLADAAAFRAHVIALIARADPDAPRPDGFVPDTVLWWVDGAEFLGRLSIRHRLTDSLARVGGHIGYAVAPAARRRGHATAMLAAALPITNALGIDPALVTCDVGNVASRRVIERNGGRPDASADGVLRFWVPTNRRPTGVNEASVRR